MAGFTRESLVAAAGVDPWANRDKFTEGDPEEIYAMARGFKSAAEEQGTAVQLTTEGLQTAGDGYQVNNATPVDVEAQVAAAKRELGNGGEKLGQIATILSDIASDLATRTTDADGKITTLEGDINGIISRFNQNSRNLPPDDYDSMKASYVADAVQKVTDANTPIKNSVDAYEEALAGHLRSLADLGYIPPSDLDEGPGDVDIPDASTAGNGTVDAANNDDQEAFEDNTAYLDLLNRKQAAGIPLTDSETQWLSDYYEVVTPHFADIKDWADETLGIEDGAKPDQNDPFVQLVSRVGDGFLNLTQNVPYDELPQEARDVLAGNLGTTDPDDQTGFYATPGERHAEDWPPNGDPNLDRFAGFVGLLNDYSSDSAAPSDEFAEHMGDAAIRWKQQINTMYVNYQADYPIADAYGSGGDKLTEDQWNDLFPDELSSDALGVVARNREYSNDWIVNDAEDRRTLMGMNWQSGQGAADVLLSASMRGDGLSDEAAARGALAIVQDASTDYDGLAARANSQVKGAIGTVGLAYIDSFAQYDTGEPGVTEITLPDGTTVSGFTLDEATNANFLKFIAASDPDIYQHFREGALERGTWYLESVMNQGHTDPSDPAYQRAISDALRLTGRTDAAPGGVLFDMAAEGAEQSQIDLRADQLAYAQAMSDYNTQKGYVDGIKNVFSVAGLIPLGPASTGVSIGSTAFGMFTDSVLKPPAAVDIGSYVDKAYDYIGYLADGEVSIADANARIDENIAAITINAAANSGHPIIDPATGRPVVADADGQYPEEVVRDVFNGIDDYSRSRAEDAINTVVRNQGGAPNEHGNVHGGGYHANFGANDGATPYEVGTLGDNSGNWTNNDDQYRIYYGDETRFRYHEPTTWDGAYIDRDVPDDDADTDTYEPAVPGAR